MRTLISGCMGSAPTDVEEDDEDENEGVNCFSNVLHEGD